MALEFTITRQGLNALFSAVAANQPLEISYALIGDGAYQPTDSQVKLANELQRVTVAESAAEDIGGSAVLSVNALFDGSGTHYVREIGLITSTGVFFGAHSVAGQTIALKTPDTPYNFRASIALSGVPASAISVTGTLSAALFLAEDYAKQGRVQVDTMRRQMDMMFKLQPAENL